MSPSPSNGCSKRLTLTAAALLIVALQAATCRAQEPPGANVTVVRPTDNGFEELVRAGDPAVDNPSTPGGKIVADAEAPTSTLTQRLAAVREPAFRNALAAFRGAMGKPITLSLSNPDDMHRFEASVMRLRRLLPIEQYVLLSEGKVPAALDAFADSLALGDRSQRQSLIGIYVGIYIEESSVKALAAHLDELSERDCGQLLSLLKTELNAPNPAAEGVRGEANSIVAMVKNNLNDTALDSPEFAAEANRTGGPNEPFRQQMRDMLRIRQNPDDWKAFQSGIARDLTAQADEAADAVANYPSPPVRVTASSPTTAVDLAAQAWVKTFGPTSQQYNELPERDGVARTYLQLLAVHAAILRWRWETNSVPDSLSALRLGALGTDIFTGQPLSYNRLDPTHYTLASAGPIKRDEDLKPLANGKREPITFVSPAP